MIIFLDESGDLGFDFITKEPSQKFVITLLVCEDRKTVQAFKTAVTRTRKNKLNRKNKNLPDSYELKGTRTTLAVKKYFYQRLPQSGWKLYSIILNKRKVYDVKPQYKTKDKLYNFLAHYLLKEVDFTQADSTITLIMDKCKTKSEIVEFNQYLESQLKGLIPKKAKLNIYHEKSHHNPGLQAVDLFCWGVFRKFEDSSSEWYEIFKDRIMFEKEYLKQK